jgi:hypothetical protein
MILRLPYDSKTNSYGPMANGPLTSSVLMMHRAKGECQPPDIGVAVREASVRAA